MNENQSLTESLINLVNSVDAKRTMLPEFQRDFRWELDQTYDLFDSLIRDIFIGTIIYGKPSFEMTLREIDIRPRKGKGSNATLKTFDYTKEKIVFETTSDGLRVVLDGQQRITSVYRAIKGVDSVYIILKRDLDSATINKLSLEEMFDYVAGEESKNAISVKLSVAYELEAHSLEDEELNERFASTAFSKSELATATTEDRKSAEKIYRRAVRKLLELYKQEKMVSFYLLDMNLDRFCLFFERSNSRGIQLNFTDILAAKLYSGFNLRKKIEEFESQNKFALNREVVVRAIAYIASAAGNRPVSIDKKAILESLDAHDFQQHWDEVCRLYTQSLTYLANQNYILSQDWMPSENMVIPIMLFLREIKSFDKMDEQRRRFLEFWYWSSVFSNRYSGASNEVIITDCRVLTQVASGQPIGVLGYFARLRPVIAEPQDLFSYTKKPSALYKGVLNLLGYAAGGLKDWNSTHTIDVSMQLEDHHIYPRAYITGGPEMADLSRTEAEQYMDCVVNRTLIPKPLNIQIGKKAPSTYLSELQAKQNPKLAECLPSHLIPVDLIVEETWDGLFGEFLNARAKDIYGLIERYVVKVASDMAVQYGTTVEDTIEQTNGKLTNSKGKLKDMLASGKVKVGDRVFTKKSPARIATIVDETHVEFEGELMPINSWGQQVTGWQSINVYESVLLERTGQPLAALRET